MLSARVIPCLDVRDGRVVKGVRFGDLRDVGAPVELARRYQGQGADEIVFLDIGATIESRRARLDWIRGVRRALSIPLTVGGGVSAADDAALLLEAGADKVAFNTAAVGRPELIAEISRRFGQQCAVLSLDAERRAEGSWRVRVRSGERRVPLDAVAWARRAEELGAGELLLTSWDRDGTRGGYDLELIAAVRAVVRIPLIASGGASRPEHLVQAVRAGADAVLAASMLHDGDYSVDRIKSALALHKVEVRQ